MPAPRVSAMAAMIATAQVKRARFAFTVVTSCIELRQPTGNRAALARSRSKIPGFASPPRGGFALDDPSDGERLLFSTQTLGFRPIQANDPLVRFSAGVRGSFRNAPARRSSAGPDTR